MQISIEIRGGREVNAKIKRLGASLMDFTNAMRLIGQRSAKYFSNEAFLSQGGVYGRVWPRLSAKTMVAKARLYPQNINRPLVASGKMKDSFVYTYSKSGTIITNTSPQYKYHQSTLPRRKIPRRQMAGINDPIKQIVRGIIQDDIKKKLRSA